MKLRQALAAATFLALPLAAHAQVITGPYVSLEGGTSILNPINYSESLKGTTGKLQYRPSYAGVAAIGYGFGNGFRVEVSGDDLHNTLHRTDSSTGSYASSGTYSSFGPMLDLLYDIPVGLPVTPYVGAGAGYQWVQASTFGPLNYSDTKGGFAYNVIAGVSYPIASVPGLSVTAEYRFQQIVSDLKFRDSVTGGLPLGSPTPGTFKFGHQSSNSFFVGLRYAMFQPVPMAPAPAPAPAPVAAAPAPAPARTYLVFFDWNKASLTPRATQIIAQAASDSHTAQTTTLDVSGYTDTSGTPTYNMGLSERRAQAVAGQLVADGVPQSEISIHAYGETHLLVPTGPGVREPQNRRVEIVLQ